VSAPVLLVGAGGHARACIDVIEQDGQYAVAGLIGLAQEVGASLLGYPVLGTDSDLPALRGQYGYAMVTAGQILSPALRINLFKLLAGSGWVLPAIVSPRAYVSRHAVLGAGTIVMHGAIVNAGAVVGRNCIINSQSLIEHDVIMGDHCHLSTTAVINGGAQVGEGTFIGSGSIMREGIKIGAHSVIGMGQRVLANCAEGSRMPFGKRVP
jgi:sugar O-acyltransferase (sialic acid O-acetyltransferase NeuD family)